MGRSPPLPEKHAVENATQQDGQGNVSRPHDEPPSRFPRSFSMIMIEAMHGVSVKTILRRLQESCRSGVPAVRLEDLQAEPADRVEDHVPGEDGAGTPFPLQE